MRTVTELKGFSKRAEKHFDADEHEQIVDYLSANPKSGKAVEHLGGVRRFAWRDDAERRIYFHPGTKNSPLVLITILKKDEKNVADKVIEAMLFDQDR